MQLQQKADVFISMAFIKLYVVVTYMALWFITSRALGFKKWTCSTQLSMKFRIHIIKKDIKKFNIIQAQIGIKCYFSCSFMLLNVGILTFMSRKNFMLSCVGHEIFYNLGASFVYEIRHAIVSFLTLNKYAMY